MRATQFAATYHCRLGHLRYTPRVHCQRGPTANSLFLIFSRPRAHFLLLCLVELVSGFLPTVNPPNGVAPVERQSKPSNGVRWEQGRRYRSSYLFTTTSYSTPSEQGRLHSRAKERSPAAMLKGASTAWSALGRGEWSVVRGWMLRCSSLPRLTSHLAPRPSQHHCAATPSQQPRESSFPASTTQMLLLHAHSLRRQVPRLAPLSRTSIALPRHHHHHPQAHLQRRR